MHQRQTAIAGISGETRGPAAALPKTLKTGPKPGGGSSRGKEKKMEKRKMTAREILAAVHVINGGDWDACYQFIKERKEKDSDVLREAAAKLEGDYVTLVEDEFRPGWKDIPKPPFVVQYEGDYGASAREGLIYVIGEPGRPSDETLSRFGIERSRAIWEDESRRIHVGDDLTMWSGNPEGRNCRLAVGIAEAVAVVSEMKPDSRPEGLLYAISEDKDVFVCPTAHRSLNNGLIKNGAFLLDGPGDIAAAKGGKA